MEKFEEARDERTAGGQGDSRRDGKVPDGGDQADLPVTIVVATGLMDGIGNAVHSSLQVSHLTSGESWTRRLTVSQLDARFFSHFSQKCRKTGVCCSLPDTQDAHKQFKSHRSCEVEEERETRSGA